MVVFKQHVTVESNRVLAAFQKHTAPIQPVGMPVASKLAGQLRNVAEQLSSSAEKGLGFVEDVNLCLGAVAAEDLRDERAGVAKGDELSPSSKKRRRGSGSPVTPRRPSKLALPTPVKKTRKARRVAKGEDALKVTLPEFNQIQDGSKREHSCKHSPYFRNKLLKQPGLSQICFSAGRGPTKKKRHFPVRIVDEGGMIKIMIGEEEIASKVPQGGMLENKDCDGVSSSEEEAEDSKCTMCSRNNEVVGTCAVCTLGMCVDCWDLPSGTETTLCKCTRCCQETDKEELRRLADAGDEISEQLLRKKEEEEEEKDKKEGAAAAEGAEQEHLD